SFHLIVLSSALEGRHGGDTGRRGKAGRRAARAAPRPLLAVWPRGSCPTITELLVSDVFLTLTAVAGSSLLQGLAAACLSGASHGHRGLCTPTPLPPEAPAPCDARAAVRPAPLGPERPGLPGTPQHRGRPVPRCCSTLNRLTFGADLLTSASPTEIRSSPAKPDGKGSKRKQDDLDDDDDEEEEDHPSWVEALSKELVDDEGPAEDPDYEPSSVETDTEEYASHNHTESDLELSGRDLVIEDVQTDAAPLPPTAE
uniref:Oogenesis-related gene n=1 Tax=Oryzias latipes TaxID=8090 RepID=A0A3P9IIF5_ORYLA